MDTKDLDILLRNNSGNKSKDALIEGFVVRTKIFDQLFRSIANNSPNGLQQHYLIIGQRGAGKTTLLYRLKYAIEDDQSLSQWLVPIMFSEEQYNISELLNLWENVAEYLEDWHHWGGISAEVQKTILDSNYDEHAAFESLYKWIKKENKQVVIFIENINMLFKKIGEEGQRRLKDILKAHNFIRIIGSSTSYFDSVTDDTKPFHQFFKVVKLEGLDQNECIQLLLRIGQQYGESEQIKNILERSPQRIEALRRLTGGVPRTISYLFQIFLDNENGKTIKDLYQLIDTLTYLYKAEMDQLSAQQQKVMDVIARNWDAISVKDIAKATRYDSKNISSILNVLERNQIIEVIPTNGKNNLYRIRERFLNIWYLMRFGRKHDKEKVIWLVRFYELWCDKTELAKRISLHIGNLKDGKYDVNAAIDMGNMFLLCENVSEDLKYSLYEATKSILPRNLIRSLKVSDDVFYTRINELIKKEEYENAMQMLEEIEVKDVKYFDFACWVYVRCKEYEKGEAAAEKAFDLVPGDGKKAFRLGYLNDDFLHNKNKAVQYFTIALDKGEFVAARELGDIFYYQNRDLRQAEKYHRIAIAQGVKSALMSLAAIYYKQGMLDEAEALCKQAVEEDLVGALNNLGLIYQMKKQYAKAITIYKRAIKKGFYQALVNIGVAYMHKRNPELALAEEAFAMAIDKEIPKAHYLMGRLYLDHYEKVPEAVSYWEQAIEKGDADAAHSLAHFFEDREEYEKSDELFLKSVKLGRRISLLCLSSSVFNNQRNEKKQWIKKVFEDNIGVVNDYGPYGKLDYGLVLLWNDQVDQSLEVFTSSFDEIINIFNSEDETEIDKVFPEFTKYVIFLIAKGQYKKAYTLFTSTVIDLKEVMKPVYYALMHFMKNDFPNEYLKAGDELRDTVNEIIADINNYKKHYH